MGRSGSSSFSSYVLPEQAVVVLLRSAEGLLDVGLSPGRTGLLQALREDLFHRRAGDFIRLLDLSVRAEAPHGGGTGPPNSCLQPLAQPVVILRVDDHHHVGSRLISLGAAAGDISVCQVTLHDQMLPVSFGPVNNRPQPADPLPVRIEYLPHKQKIIFRHGDSLAKIRLMLHRLEKLREPVIHHIPEISHSQCAVASEGSRIAAHRVEGVSHAVFKPRLIHAVLGFQPAQLVRRSGPAILIALSDGLQALLSARPQKQMFRSGALIRLCCAGIGRAAGNHTAACFDCTCVSHVLSLICRAASRRFIR